VPEEVSEGGAEVSAEEVKGGVFDCKLVIWVNLKLVIRHLLSLIKNLTFMFFSEITMCQILTEEKAHVVANFVK